MKRSNPTTTKITISALIASIFPISFIDQAAAQLKAEVMISRERLAAFLHTSNAKIAFVGGTTGANRCVYYLDCSENGASFQFLRKIPGSEGASSVSIALDGKLCAYNIDGTGQSKGAALISEFSETAKPILLASENAYEPRFEKRTDSTIIEYTATWTSGDWAFGKTLAKPFNRLLPNPPAFPITISGSFHGGLSWDRRYLASTQFEPNPRIIDLATRTVHVLHRLEVNNIKTGAESIVSPQTCNCSISSSRIFTDAMLYLDFGLPDSLRHPVLGTWGFHKRIFVADSRGVFLRWFDFPESPSPIGNGTVTSRSWTHTEWSANHPYYAIAGVIVSRAFPTGDGYQGTENCEAIYLIDMKDNTCIKVIESTDTSVTSTTNLQWPALWVEMQPAFIEDSSWLHQGRASNAPLREIRWHERNGISVRGYTVVSEKPIKKISVTNLTGQLMYTRRLSGSPVFSFRIPANLRSGRYLVTAITDAVYTIPFHCCH
jgi:hypothetical protein